MTAMRDIDDFLPEVLRFAPNASDVVAQRFILQAARDLCDRAKLWRETDRFQITTPTLQGVCTINDAAIVEIEAAYLDGAKLEPVQVSWLNREHPLWALETEETGTARYVTQMTPNTVTVYPAQSGTMTIMLVLKPSRDAFSLPDFLLEDYSEEIGRGAAGRMLTEPSSDNPQLGAAHLAWFEQKLNAIALKATKGQQNAPPRTRGAYF